MGDSEEIEKYLTLLDESVQDGRLTYEESRRLSNQARRTRLTGTQLGELHRRAWEKAFPDHAETPWEAMSATRRREMFLLAEELGLEDTAAELKSVIEEYAEPEPSPEIRHLRGLRIGIVGDHPELDLLRERAGSHGAQLAKRITKTVQWMATITPEASDSHHNLARELGIPIISPAEANERLEESIRAAELKAFERQRYLDEMEAERADYEAQREAYWRPVWRPIELDHDPEYNLY